MQIGTIETRQFKKFLVGNSIGASAVRNQGKGIINPIRETLCEQFNFHDYYSVLVAKNEIEFLVYLDYLTNSLVGLAGYNTEGNLTGSRVKWGTARKCVNLLLRTCAYNGHFWEHFGISKSDFAVNKFMQKLELPLDSYSIKGIKWYADFLGLTYTKGLFKGFSIIDLEEHNSLIFQGLMADISRVFGICRIDWDIFFWRQEDQD